MTSASRCSVPTRRDEVGIRCSESKQPSTGEPSEFSESPEKRALESSLITSRKFFAQCFPVRIGAFAISPAGEAAKRARWGGTKRAGARARGAAEPSVCDSTPKGPLTKFKRARKNSSRNAGKHCFEGSLSDFSFFHPTLFYVSELDDDGDAADDAAARTFS